MKNVFINKRVVHSMVDRTPYTYLIGWSKLNKWYYGKRIGKYVHPSDLWVKYFTSSTEVENFRKQNGEPDVVEVRKIFISTEKCTYWETRVLLSFNVSSNDRWLNKKPTPWNNQNKTAAMIFSTKEHIGSIDLNDPRWKTGEICGTSKGIKYKVKNPLKQVYNLLTGESFKVSKNHVVNFPIIKINRNSSIFSTIYAEEINTGIMLGKIPLQDTRWKTGTIKTTKRTDKKLKSFLKKKNLTHQQVNLKTIFNTKMSPRQKEAFMLCILMGHDLSYAANLMGCSEGSIKTHIFRAASRL